MRTWLLPFLGAVALATPFAPAAEAIDDAAFERLRQEMRERRRRVILNNDGGDAIMESQAPTPEALLAARTADLAGTHVDTIFYCTNRGSFSRHSHRSEVSETFVSTEGRYAKNIVGPLLEQGTDPLQVVIDWCRENGVEIFWSERMNDMHDSGSAANYSRWKQEHPQYLMGTPTRRPPHGGWSQVDYTEAAVREQMLRVVSDVCRRYDVDGIELDFMRHPCFLRTVSAGGVATEAERDLLSDLMGAVRAMTEDHGRRRGRPFLVALRVPDSVPFCRDVGIDLERWLAAGWVDLLVGSCYFQLNPWEHLVELGHRYGVRVYAGLSETRIDKEMPPLSRRGQESYRGRALRAWQSGVDGLYLFNFFRPRAPMLREIGDPRLLAGLDKVYFATVRGTRQRTYANPDYWLADGARHRTLPVLSLADSLQVNPGETVTMPLAVGDDLSAPASRGVLPQATAWLLASHPDRLQVRLNDRDLGAGRLDGPWLALPLPAGVLRPGENRFQFTALAPVVGTGAAPGAQATAWDGTWTATALPQPPWQHDRFRGEAIFARLEEGALLVADRGSDAGDYLYFRQPWNAVPEEESVVEAEVRVVAGWSNLTISNGRSIERLTLRPDGIGTHYSGWRHELDAAAHFRLYRVAIRGSDITVSVDGDVVLTGAGMFTQPAAGRNEVAFGAANSPSQGEALWRAVRWRAPGRAVSVQDLAVTVRFGTGGTP